MKEVTREYDAAKDRISKLDTLIENLYEDKVSGVLSADRFQKLTDKYEQAQQNLKDKVFSLKQFIEAEHEKAVNINAFVEKVKSYTEVKELTPEVVREFIDKIVVYQPARLDGKKVQKLRIYYKCIGAVDIPMTIEEKKTA